MRNWKLKRWTKQKKEAALIKCMRPAKICPWAVALPSGTIVGGWSNSYSNCKIRTLHTGSFNFDQGRFVCWLFYPTKRRKLKIHSVFRSTSGCCSMLVGGVAIFNFLCEWRSTFKKPQTRFGNRTLKRILCYACGYGLWGIPSVVHESRINTFAELKCSPSLGLPEPSIEQEHSIME